MALTTEVTPLDDDRVRLDVAVPADEVQRQLQRTLQRIGGQMKVPGFRPGHVPADMVMQRLGRDAVVQEMLQDAISDWYAEAVADAGVRPIADPEIDTIDEVPEDSGLSFRAAVQLRPTAQLGDYRGLEVGRDEAEIPEGAVEAELERLREQAGRLGVVDRAVQDGDFVLIDFDGNIDGARVRNASARDYLVEVGAGKLMEEFDSQLTGMKSGDTATFTVSYGDADQRAGLQGKTVDYEVTLKLVQERQLPPLDDDLALEVSEFETLEQLRGDLEQRVSEAVESQIDELYRRRVIDAVAGRATVDVPRIMIDRRVAAILQETAQQLPEGTSLEDYLAANGKGIEEIIQELRPDAELAVRRELVVEAVADAEDLVVTDDQVEAQVREDAASTGRDAEGLLRKLHDGGAFEALRSDLRLQKAVDILVESATPIPLETAQAREKLWTPGSEAEEAAGAKLWTPGDPT